MGFSVLSRGGKKFYKSPTGNIPAKNILLGIPAKDQRGI
jgi:hypothetical protein